MSKKTELYKKALALRKKGLSYNEIRRSVPVAKSSLSLWLKNIPLSPEHRERLYTKRISVLALGAPSQKERRKHEIEKIVTAAKEEITVPLPPDVFRMLGAALYWAEGTKSKNFEITNSDPLLIVFMVRWFAITFNLSPTTFKPCLNIYPQQDEAELKRFWSDLTGIPVMNFNKSFVKPVNKGYKKNNLYYGTIKIRVPKGTDMKWKVYGWIKGALQDFEPKIQSVERKWASLKSVERPPVNVDPLIA